MSEAKIDGPIIRFGSGRFGMEPHGLKSDIDFLDVTFTHPPIPYRVPPLSLLFDVPKPIGNDPSEYALYDFHRAIKPLLPPVIQPRENRLLPTKTTFTVIPEGCFVPGFGDIGLYMLDLIQLVYIHASFHTELPNLVEVLERYEREHQLVEAHARLVERAVKGIKDICELR